MATSVSANITIDNIAVSASTTEATTTTPVCHGPITVYVNNGTDTGDIREKLATITVRVKGKELLNTITVGAKLKLPITIGTGAEIMMFDGVVYEAAYSPVDRETIDVTLTGKDDQTALKLHGSSPSDLPAKPDMDRTTRPAGNTVETRPGRRHTPRRLTDPRLPRDPRRWQRLERSHRPALYTVGLFLHGRLRNHRSLDRR